MIVLMETICVSIIEQQTHVGSHSDILYWSLGIWKGLEKMIIIHQNVQH